MNSAELVTDVLSKDNRLSIALLAPSAGNVIAKAFHLKKSPDNIRILVSLLKKAGFTHVWLNEHGADITIAEMWAEFADRQNNRSDLLPLLGSSCPAWVNYIKKFQPHLAKHLSAVKSPMGTLGALAKSGLLKLPGENPFVVGIMPCVAKKTECINDVDIVLTANETVQIIRSAGINPSTVLPSEPDRPIPCADTSGTLFGESCDLTTSFLRHGILVNNGSCSQKITALKTNGKSVSHSTIINNISVRTVRFFGISDAVDFLRSVSKNKSSYQYIEVMTCPGGCANGGGIFTSGSRLPGFFHLIKSIFDGSFFISRFTKKAIAGLPPLKKHLCDKTNVILSAPVVHPYSKNIYDTVLGSPMSTLSKKYLHRTAEMNPKENGEIK